MMRVLKFWNNMPRDATCGGVHSFTAKLCTTLCMLAMAGIGIAAVAWWGMSWVTIVFLIIGLACLLSILYAWLMARRVDRLLEKQGRPIREEPAHDKELARKRQDSEK